MKRKGCALGLVFASVLGAIALLLGAMLFLRLYGPAPDGVSSLERARSSARPGQQEGLRGVVVAARDLPMGTVIAPVDLRLVHAPQDDVPYSTFEYTHDLVGRVVRERVLEGEAVREERLADPEAGVGLQALVPRGIRALPVQTDASGLARAATGGASLAYSDVYAFDPKDPAFQPCLVVSAVPVLPVLHGKALDGSGTATAWLGLVPKQVLRIETNRGRTLRLGLRGPTDLKPTALPRCAGPTEAAP